MIKVGDKIKTLKDSWSIPAGSILDVESIIRHVVTAQGPYGRFKYDVVDEGVSFELAYRPVSLHFSTPWSSPAHTIWKPSLVCECGAEKVNSQRHSSWCAKHITV